MKSILCECAWSMVRKKDSYLSKFYWRLKAKRGSQKAIVAVARKMLVIIYFMLKNNTMYSEEHFSNAKEKYEQSRKKRFLSEAQKLGFAVIPIEQQVQ